MAELGLVETARYLEQVTGEPVDPEALRRRVQRAEAGRPQRKPLPAHRRDDAGRIWFTVDDDEIESVQDWRQRALTAEARVARLERVIDELLASGRRPRRRKTMTGT